MISESCSRRHTSRRGRSRQYTPHGSRPRRHARQVSFFRDDTRYVALFSGLRRCTRASADSCLRSMQCRFLLILDGLHSRPRGHTCRARHSLQEPSALAQHGPAEVRYPQSLQETYLALEVARHIGPRPHYAPSWSLRRSSYPLGRLNTHPTLSFLFSLSFSPPLLHPHPISLSGPHLSQRIPHEPHYSSVMSPNYGKHPPTILDVARRSQVYRSPTIWDSPADYFCPDHSGPSRPYAPPSVPSRQGPIRYAHSLRFRPSTY